MHSKQIKFIGHFNYIIYFDPKNIFLLKKLIIF